MITVKAGAENGRTQRAEEASWRVPCVTGLHRAWLSLSTDTSLTQLPCEVGEGLLAFGVGTQKRRECPVISSPRLLLLTRGVETQGRRHPVVIVTEALSAQRHTRPRSTDLETPHTSPSLADSDLYLSA